MNNSEVFNLVCCRVFDAVMSVFPLPARLLKQEIMRDIESDSGLDDLFYYSVTWLERHGYIEIKAKELGSSCFDLVFPTEKTLAIMNAVPDALKGSRKSILEDIKDCLKMGTSQAIADAVKNIWNAGVSLF